MQLFFNQLFQRVIPFIRDNKEGVIVPTFHEDQQICDEIKLRSSELNEDIHSIYFGGGTPSIMNKSNISLILNTIHDSFKIIKNPEVTLECNPDDINLSKIESWKSSKINRISLWVDILNN